jgi:hypothetical protein
VARSRNIRNLPGLPRPIQQYFAFQGRSISLEDFFAVIEIAIQAEGFIPCVRDLFFLRDYAKVEIEEIDDDHELMSIYVFDRSKVKRVRPCTAANVLADRIMRSGVHRSGVERLRREFRRCEEYYRSLARNCMFMIEWAIDWSRYPWDMLPAFVRVSLEHEITTAIAEYPELPLYISQVVLPALSELHEELHARARRMKKESDSLAERRDELEIIQRWHVLADFEGLAVSDGTGKKQLQEAIDGINALRSNCNQLI